MTFQSYCPVPNPQTFGGGNRFESPKSNGGSYNNGLKSHKKSPFGSEGFQCYNSYNEMLRILQILDTNTLPHRAQSRKENNSLLEFSAPKKWKNPVRAGVIRHGSRPQECLAYYFVGN